jgi:hypothetical protein
VTVLAAGSAFAAPTLRPGQTSGPHNGRGTCTRCHNYATAPAPKPAAAPTLFSRPVLKAAKFKSGRNFAAVGYIAPTVCSAADATVTVSVQRLAKGGRWVAVPILTRTAAVTDTGKYAGKVNYRAVMRIKKLGKFRLRAKLEYLNADGASLVKWSKTTVVTIKK